MAMLLPRALAVLSLAAFGQPHASYTIHRATSPIAIDAKLDEAAWRDAPAMGDFHFHWYKSGDKEQTIAKMLWDDQFLYVSWYVRDAHISAYEKQRHGPVSKDDCVEIFIAPNPANTANYYTWEINAIGTMLNRNKSDWYKLGPTWEPQGVEYRASFHNAGKKEEAPGDDHWIVEMKIPFDNFQRDAAHTPPNDGDEWRLNLNRIGGKTNAQLSSWSPIAPPLTSFHSPAAFGRVTFSTRPARSFDPQQAAAGHGIYNRSCTMCHGLDGAAGDRAPALGAQRRYLRVTPSELFDSIRNGIRGTNMPASPLPETDIHSLVAYIQSLRATASDLNVPGDPARGREVFESQGKCLQCHRINGRGGILGPDLSNIGAERSLAALRESLTTGKPLPPRGFQPVTVITADGRTINGVLKNQHNTSFQILGTDEKLHLLTAQEIKQMTLPPKSFMPSQFDKSLTGEDFQNLLAFLSRQARNRR